MRHPGRIERSDSEAADISDMVQRLERLFADAIAYLEGLSASAAAGPTTAPPEPLLEMLGQQQVLVEALEQEIAQGRTGGLSGAELEAIVDGLQARNEQCRRLLVAHVEALERRLAAAQRRQNRSRSYRAQQPGGVDMRGPGR